MKILAIDTATERCSVALSLGERLIERSTDVQRGHAELILPMIAEVLEEGGQSLQALDGVAYGRGPGAFTGVRIAIGVVQGLAFGARLPTVGISDLAAVAQQVARPGDQILVCMDARMGEVYWARFTLDSGSAHVRAMSEERVDRPESIPRQSSDVFAGTGFKAYPQMVAPGAPSVHESVLPRAREIAALAETEFLAGRGLPAARAAPVYLRDRVAFVKK
ncbi:MAG: tRNA (adenosine(37)-N6)-threonylcarbamoyltransferase complex dimerization subunit type 1 TsaB [Steroidobacter sp.]